MNDVFKSKLVVDMNNRLEKIYEGLHINSVSSCDGDITSIGVTIPVKGNSEIIKKLEKIGFNQKYKEKTPKGFVVRMDYPIYYDTYAIFQKEYGLTSYLYIDNINDFKRLGIFGNPDFPMLVNRAGGHCSFDEEYDRQRGFLYLKKVPEGEEPLTREERYPKNSEKFFYGWISPAGDTYTCSFEGHYNCAEAICEELGYTGYNSESILEEKGWLKVSREAPYTPDNINSRVIYTTQTKLTKKQKEIIYEQKLDNDWRIKWLLEDEI